MGTGEKGWDEERSFEGIHLRWSSSLAHEKRPSVMKVLKSFMTGDFSCRSMKFNIETDK